MCPSLFFVITCFFTVTTNLFVLFEVELIINNAPLTYHYPNTIVTYLTLNHLLFGRQLFNFSSTTSAVVRNLGTLGTLSQAV